MYGKHFDSMYEGSMIGSGAAVFAVWGYCIAKMKPPQFELELNPVLLAFLLGEDEQTMVSAIEKLCSPDAKSRSKEEEGRRLLKKGEYLYKVVNGAAYHEIRNNEEKRAYWRNQKRKLRDGDTEEPEEPETQKEPKKVVDPIVEKIWEAYPRKVSKGRAITAIENAIKTGIAADELLNKTVAYAKTRVGEDEKYTPHPATWFNQGRYNDSLTVPDTSGQNGTPAGQTREQYLSNMLLRTPHLMTPEEKKEAMRLAM